jgi:hypothetical protein
VAYDRGKQNFVKYNFRLLLSFDITYKMNVNNDKKEECKGQTEQRDSGSNCANDDTSLTLSQKARIERNRRTALLLKQARLMPHPYAKM